MPGSDIVIVGGGIIGAASAYELARRGASVTLVERAELAAGASGRNQGWFVPSADPPLVPMARSSLEMYTQVIEDSVVPVRFDRGSVGHLLVTDDAASAAMVRERVDGWSAVGVRAERLDATAVRHEEPALADDLEEVWRLDHGRRIDPGALTIALALRARDLGADVRTHTNVRTLAVARERITGVVTDDGVIAAGTVILAAGPWSAALTRPLGIELPVGGARGWIVELAGSPRLLRHLIEEEDGEDFAERVPTATELATDTALPGVSALLHASDEGTIVCGASHHPALFPEAEDTDAPARIVRRAIRIAPSLGGLSVRGIRWGIRPTSPDGRPLVGPLRDGLLAATGHGPEGVMLGGGTAALVAAMATGDAPPFDPTAVDPARFAPN